MLSVNSKIVDIVILSGLLSLAFAGALGAFGAITHYLFLILTEEVSYSTITLFSYSIMGFFVGMVSSELMVWWFDDGVNGIILISGFLFLRILKFINTDGSDFIMKRLHKN